ncbi:MAG: M23 family metallopeptidase [Thermaurantimonas sp.]|uniref:M23 family metallopeptidase n=1 Tax=Thermaurantimonas sp. TaxID=2681568 RepID=UPI00391D7B94
MAKKHKYIYDPVTLSYKRLEPSIWKQVGNVLLFLLSSGLFAFLFLFFSKSFLVTPREKELMREIDYLTLNYELLKNKLNTLEQALLDLENRDDNIYRVIFEAEPIPANLRRSSLAGINRYKNLDGYATSELVKETTQRLDKLRKQAYIQSRSYDEVLDLIKNKNKLLASIPAIQPIANKNLTAVASGFGMRIHPIYKVLKMHTGIDFTAPVGTPIYATGDGVVIQDNGIGGSGYGLYVIISHGFGYHTLYAHMSKAIVKPGQKVKRGDIIGYVGNTGSSTGPHLHYEVIKNGIKVDPINYFFNDLTPEEFDLMLRLARQENQSFD